MPGACMTMRKWLIPALIAVNLCVTSCATEGSRRDMLKRSAFDPSRPISRRIEAFDALLDTIDSGTREEIVWKYVKYDTRTRISDGEVFSAHLIAPDGADRWLTIVDGAVE